jgi:thiamine-monophosphate kinase
MALEFDLIQAFFQRNTRVDDISVGIGDDAAIVNVPPGMQLVVTTDTLVEGVHFLETDAATDIGFKSLAVNFSDLAAMGAIPKWFTLSLCMPTVDKIWLASFSTGLFELADTYKTVLIGGDTTKGPLNICIQALGVVPEGQAIGRSTAVSDDDIYVTGTLGDAALGLLSAQHKVELSDSCAEVCQGRLRRPFPRVEMGAALRSIAHSMIDCSDGFAADVAHILSSSKKSAEIWLEKIPMSKVVKAWLSDSQRWEVVLSGGDDYELIFTAAPKEREVIELLAVELSCSITRVGKITHLGETLYVLPNGQALELQSKGYSHFE